MEPFTDLERASGHYLAGNLPPTKALKLLFQSYRNKIKQPFNYLAFSIKREQKRIKEIEASKQFHRAAIGGLSVKHIISMLEDEDGKNGKK